MSHTRHSRSGWQGACLVAITYVYFLIFAQFAFLKRLATLGISGNHLNSVMAAMASGGILLSLLAPRLNFLPAPNLRLRIGLIICSVAAFSSLLPLGLFTIIAVSFLIGAGLGLLTVTLVTHLRQWTGNRNPLLLVGLGTGVGYLVCNLPPFFIASAEMQSVVAGLLCLAGVGATLFPALVPLNELRVASKPALPFFSVLACFTALVWLDSAAFFIIQNTPSLKAGTWQGSLHLSANALLHLVAALISVWLLRRRSLSVILSAAFVVLGSACLLLLAPRCIVLASIFYPVGVSLYSVALVAYPALLSPATSTAERGRQAGWLYAIAGWAGSALGIGMGQHLGYIPPLFVLAAGAVILLTVLFRFLLRRKRELLLTVAILIASLSLDRIVNATRISTPLSQLEHGRKIYISEGCINCHTQYVRPNSPDVLLWGPVESFQQLHQQKPPLIGNRRQGPDLAEVGSRRSELWLKAHFYNPPEVSGASIMPSYAFLFQDQRGDDLVAYLMSLKTSGAEEHQSAELLWRPSAAAIAQANPIDGEQLFQRHCSTCHSANGHTRLAWKSSFKQLPPDLAVGPFYYLTPSGIVVDRVARLAQIAKFGVPGTDMPGHEYLSDQDISSIALWLSQQIAQPIQNR
jgi:cbb3-type cytochrome c oxidase subunit II